MQPVPRVSFGQSSLFGVSFHDPRVAGQSGSITDLFPVVQALIVVLHDGRTLRFPRSVFGVGVDDVTGEEFLPERQTARGT